MRSTKPSSHFMTLSNKHLVLLLLITSSLFLSTGSLTAQDTQDSIPQVVVDTTEMETIVIRTLPEKAGVKRAGARISNQLDPLKKTKALQEKPKRFHMPSFWKKKNKVSFNLNEVAFVNWNAGGDNSVAVLTAARFERNYAFRYISWENAVDFRFGLNMREGQGLEKQTTPFVSPLLSGIEQTPFPSGTPLEN